MTDGTEGEVAAWGAAAGSAPRWPASLAVVAALLMYVTLPQKYVAGPRWLLPALEAALLIPLTALRPRRHHGETRVVRFSSLALIAIVNLANVASLIQLIRDLLHGRVNDGYGLLLAAAQIWLTNVAIFGLWFWELDRGGPGARTIRGHRSPDFLFPQMTNPQSARAGWTPEFVDYLYVSFTNATAFSPTDTMPLTRSAKLLMAVQSLASLLTVALVAARAVNILR